MIIAIDFDGTCVTHEFPRVGKDIGAVPVLKKLVEQGHQLILWTMRCDDETSLSNPKDDTVNNLNGPFLTDAINWFKANNIPLFGIQRNPDQDIWTTSPKAYAQLYIDDAALGCPLIYPEEGRPYVHWYEVEKMLIKQGIL